MDLKNIKENFAYLRNVLGVRHFDLSDVSESLNENEIPLIEEVPLAVAELLPAQVGSLVEVRNLIGDCQRCKLSRGRKNIVFGQGSPTAELMFVGEGPGEQEDLEGFPFVGPAGQLLTKMILAMGLKREEVYIANVVKCRPPLNRNPEPDEIKECLPFLQQQIQLVNPKVIVALGSFAAQALLATEEKISRLRGSVLDRNGRKLVATFHPSYLLRNPSQKKVVWDDLQLAMQELGLKKTR